MTLPRLQRKDQSTRPAHNIFSLDRIAVSYEKQAVLKNISLSISMGERIALIGPSGAGKTTLLRKLSEIALSKAALIHQDYALVPQLSVFHNVFIGRLDRNSTYYNLLNLIKPQKAEVRKVAAILEELELSDKLVERVASLSGGQQQRVAIGRALFREAEVILADEPVSSIDPHQAGKVLKLLLSKSPTLVTSLHSVQFAMSLFDRIVGLRDGEISFDLPRSAVRESMLSDLFRPC